MQTEPKWGPRERVGSPRETGRLAVKKFCLGAALCVLVGCGGDDPDIVFADPYSPFIYWEGSANGELVADATGDFFRFRSDSGNLIFGATEYRDVYVDINSDLVWDGEIIGAILLVAASDGVPIAAMVGNDGYLLDVYGPEFDLYWQPTDIEPVEPFCCAAGEFSSSVDAPAPPAADGRAREVFGGRSAPNAFMNRPGGAQSQ